LRHPFDEVPRRLTGRKLAFLDTNIWRYVVDCKAQGQLLTISRDGNYDVQIAPAVLYETLRLKDIGLRDKLVRLMVSDRFHRLMPEAYSESMEILREIARVRPDWLRERPDVKFYERLRKDWSRRTGGFWVRCERLPSSEARFLSKIYAPFMEAAQKQAHAARKEMIEIGWTKNPSMDKTLMGFTHPVPGWRGDPVEAWRLDSLIGLSFGLRYTGNAYRDWIAPFVELDDGLLDSAAWVEFWLYLAERTAMPRQWMRWAHSFAQRFRKVTSGSPADTQLSTYFFETDVVITADKIMIEILDECRRYAPCRLPEGRLVPGGKIAVDHLFQTILS
jgi:hypothetical protein